MQKLPPLTALKAFDAAARHLSFTAAAAELYVTHGAVSRQIAALEQELKVALFVRGARGLKLTAEGAQFARGVGTAFDTLRSAVAQVRHEGPAEALRVSVPPTLAMRWLIPRMSDLHHAHPRLHIELTTSTEPVDFEAGEYDAAIRRIRQVPRGLLATRFLDARPVPVCSPAYQEQHRLRGPADLRRATLILTRSEPQAWPDWLRANHVQRPASAHTIAFEQLYFALQAALDSLGVALAPASLVQEEIQRRRLCALAQPEGPVLPSYALLAPKVSVHSDAIRTFGEWLMAASKA
jgi:LysR family transcriptional regulator, glycine cleavage system transcriptional activator